VIELTRAAERLHRTDPGAARHRNRYMREQLAACRRLAAWLERERKLAGSWTVETAADMLRSSQPTCSSAWSSNAAGHWNNSPNI
jgi:hypothetical protein